MSGTQTEITRDANKRKYTQLKAGPEIVQIIEMVDKEFKQLL